MLGGIDTKSSLMDVWPLIQQEDLTDFCNQWLQSGFQANRKRIEPDWTVDVLSTIEIALRGRQETSDRLSQYRGLVLNSPTGRWRFDSAHSAMTMLGILRLRGLGITVTNGGRIRVFSGWGLFWDETTVHLDEQQYIYSHML